jgi:hypothetical protein
MSCSSFASGLGHRLGRVPADAPDAQRRRKSLLLDARKLLGGELQQRRIKDVLRITDGELRGVHAEGHAARTGGEVIAQQRALAAFVKAAVCIERQRAGGNDLAGLQLGVEFGFQFGGHTSSELSVP